MSVGRNTLATGEAWFTPDGQFIMAVDAENRRLVVNAIATANGQPIAGGSGLQYEVPSGDVDDVNTTFILSATPVGATLFLVNGIMIPPSGYSVLGNVLTAAVAPKTGDSVAVAY